jgi:yeast amino acid transporter
MTSTGISNFGKAEWGRKSIEERAPRQYEPDDSDDLKPVYDTTHRKLKPRHIQLIGIGGYL